MTVPFADADSTRSPWERWGWVVAAIWLVFLTYPVLETFQTDASTPAKGLSLALIASVNQDAEAITEIVARVGDVPADFDESELHNSIQEFLDEYAHQSLGEFDLSGCLNEIITIIRSHQIYLPSKIAMLLKVLIMLEGTAQQLSPKFNLAELIKPYGELALRNRYSPKRLFARVKSTYKDWDRLMTILPKDVADILHNMKRGKFDVHLEHRKLEPIVNRLVSLHHGQLTAHSRGPGMGSCFTVTLPAVTLPAAQPFDDVDRSGKSDFDLVDEIGTPASHSPPQDVCLDGNRNSLLLVDDNADSTAILADMTNFSA